MKYSNRNAWFKNIPSDLPILLLSGDEDPVGNYGEGIVLVADKLKKHGKNAKYILYKGARHEILNDFTYDNVLLDIEEFIK
jgi:alpha-beta hydrolase superfamily lysophospholipase